jgi:hypothetical protein
VRAGIPPPRFTDGLENASREYTREQVFQRIRHQSDVYGWEFVYLGAKLDAIAAGRRVGVAGSDGALRAASHVFRPGRPPRQPA